MSDNKEQQTTQRLKMLDLEDDDVIGFTNSNGDIRLYKISEIRRAIKNRQSIESYDQVSQDWIHFSCNPDCEALKVGGNWKKGKLKIKFILETCYDEEEPEEQKKQSESPLDDIRRSLNENGS